TEGALAAAASALDGGTGYAHVYLDELDSLMHAVGPDDPLVEAGAGLVLDALAGATFPPGTLVLLTADHGMSPVDPARTVYVNELWPGLAELMETGADGKPLGPGGGGGAREKSRSPRPGPAAISSSTFAKGISTRCAPGSGSVSTAWPTSSRSTSSWPRASSRSRRRDCGSGARPR